MNRTTLANPDVLEFYDSLPFNYHCAPEADAAEIRRNNAIEAYPTLLPLLSPDARVVDIGCGAGWFANSAAYYYGCTAAGIDFCGAAVKRAKEVALALNLSTEFQQLNLFDFRPAVPFDLVVSIGVLHHTNDCIEGLRHLCRHCVKENGYVFIGLYHRYGRRPFLDHFQGLKSRMASEKALLKEFKRLRGGGQDQTHVYSWFRDQVLHPHETQHTLREIMPVLCQEGVELVSTSLNGFRILPEEEELFALEKTLFDKAKDMLAQGRYFPGFFMFLGRKTSDVR